MKCKEKIFSAVIDRPVGFKDSFGNVYPINYGYIPELMGGDGEEQDVYIISHDPQQPLENFTGKLVAIIHRRDDIEDKWVLAPVNEEVDKTLIAEQTHFMEQYFLGLRWWKKPLIQILNIHDKDQKSALVSAVLNGLA